MRGDRFNSRAACLNHESAKRRGVCVPSHTGPVDAPALRRASSFSDQPSLNGFRVTLATTTLPYMVGLPTDRLRANGFGAKDPHPIQNAKSTAKRLIPSV